MYSANQLELLQLYKRPHLIVGESALVYNKLMNGNNALCLYTPYPELHNVRMLDVRLEHYHNVQDDEYVSICDVDNMIFVPTAERAIVDTIMNLDHNYIEGPLIESLQNYLRYNDVSVLYVVADYYGLSREELNYWIKEAYEDSDMSMG